MTTYRRGPTEPWQEVAAAAAGLLTGAAAFWLARTWLRRQPLPSGRPAPDPPPARAAAETPPARRRGASDPDESASPGARGSR